MLEEGRDVVLIGCVIGGEERINASEGPDALITPMWHDVSRVVMCECDIVSSAGGM